jgi:membrane-associated phospholipid phosphatase
MWSLFSCYWLALATFLAFPVVGPCIAFPRSFDGAYANTTTAAVMASMRADLQSIQNNTGIVSGLGYFIAIPSLHVAVAMLLQSMLPVRDLRFWALLPVNIAVVASTFLLGYHYAIDMVAGALLTGIALAVLHPHRPQSSSSAVASAIGRTS